VHFNLRNEIILKTLIKNSKVIHLYLLKGEGGLLLYMTATMVTNSAETYWNSGTILFVSGSEVMF
jgi:hypothetical protein